MGMTWIWCCISMESVETYEPLNGNFNQNTNEMVMYAAA